MCRLSTRSLAHPPCITRRGLPLHVSQNRHPVTPPPRYNPHSIAEAQPRGLVQLSAIVIVQEKGCRPLDEQRPEKSHNPEDRGPGVRIPPPLVTLAAILIGAAIDRVFPIGVPSVTFTGWLGTALALFALVLGPGLSFREYRKARTPIRPDRPATALVATGPFRYTRNPMYLSLLILQTAVGLWMNNAWVIVLVAPVTAWLRWRVIAAEERYMIRQFGQAYLDYQAKVRRWL